MLVHGSWNSAGGISWTVKVPSYIYYHSFAKLSLSHAPRTAFGILDINIVILFQLQLPACIPCAESYHFDEVFVVSHLQLKMCLPVGICTFFVTNKSINGQTQTCRSHT